MGAPTNKLPFHAQEMAHYCGVCCNMKHYPPYIKALAQWSLLIIQLGYQPLNVVGHFMSPLNRKAHPTLYKTYPYRHWFCNTMAPYSLSHYSLFIFPFMLVTSLNIYAMHSVIKKWVYTCDSKICTTLNP